MAGLVAAAALFVYAFSLFNDLEALMTRTPESLPTTIYSDVFLLKKGDIYDNSFLTERLRDLGYEFHETPERIEWKGRAFNYPPAVLPPDSSAVAHAEEPVSVGLVEGKVDSITIGGRPSDAVALEPEPVAVLSGVSHAVQTYVRGDDIPAQLRFAVMATEDQRFLEHHGFDPRSFARAVVADIRARALNQGGSTLTQQLVKNLLGSHQKTLFRKARELILAILIEIKYTKEDILTKYLNEVYFGQIGSLEVHGVAEAAKLYFNKRLDRLSLGEVAFLTGLLRGPQVYSPYRHLNKALERKNVVLKLMADQGLITQEECKKALNDKITIAPPSMSNNHAPYFADYVKSEVLDQAQDQSWAGDLSTEGLRIFTTLDLPLQRRADRAVAEGVREVEARYKIHPPLKLESLLVAADYASGYIRALVGGRSYSETTFNRVLNMKRQVGSTFKPIAYLAALVKGADQAGVPYSGAYQVDNTPWSLRLANGKTWAPKNYERGHEGRITLREAFENSINIPMARIGNDVGIDNVIEIAHKLGITTPLPNVPSLVLGSVDLNPMELLQTYSTIANRGERVQLTAVRSIQDKDGNTLAHFETRRDAEVEPRIVDILSDLLAGVVREGTGKLMTVFGYGKPARGKTGTTNLSRDAWFAGFSQGLVAVSWTGFDDTGNSDSDEDAPATKTKPAALLTGAGAALPLWAGFFRQAKPSKLVEPDPATDPSLEHLKIDRTSGLRAKPTCPAEDVYDEVFIPGTAPAQDCNRH